MNLTKMISGFVHNWLAERYPPPRCILCNRKTNGGWRDSRYTVVSWNHWTKRDKNGKRMPRGRADFAVVCFRSSCQPFVSLIKDLGEDNQIDVADRKELRQIIMSKIAEKFADKL